MKKRIKFFIKGMIAFFYCFIIFIFQVNMEENLKLTFILLESSRAPNWIRDKPFEFSYPTEQSEVDTRMRRVCLVFNEVTGSFPLYALNFGVKYRRV